VFTKFDLTTAKIYQISTYNKVNLPQNVDSSIHANLNSLAFELFALQQRGLLHETGFLFMPFSIDGLAYQKSFSEKRDQSLINIAHHFNHR